MSNINGSEFMDSPLDTSFSEFTSILGGAFFLIPIGFIALALFIKTRNVAAVSIWLMGSSLLVGTSVFGSYPQMGFIYYLFAVIGLVGTIVSIYLDIK